MRKYIFTESQLKKILDNQINEQQQPNQVIKSSVSKMTSYRSFYNQSGLNTFTYRVNNVKGKPMMNANPISIHSVITPHDTLTVHLGDEIMVSKVDPITHKPVKDFQMVTIFGSGNRLVCDVTSN